MLFNAKNITGGFEMENKIFISWSGEKSKQIASTFYDWFYNTFKIEAWFSSKNIKIGKLWEPKIQEALQQSTKGIFFITKENVFAPWINFEAGAISKGNPENFVCIIRVDSNEIPKESPLFHYQNTAFNKEGICELLNNILIDSPDYNEENFKKLFDTNWKEFYKKYLKIIYSDNPLLDEKYAPGFISIIPENNKKELKKADKRSINNFFKQEYEKIDPNSIGKRLQFIIDRTVIFVYLDNNECWGKYVSELERINSEQNSRKDFKSYQIAILILKEVFSYHKMMSGTEYEYSINSEPEDINDELKDLNNRWQFMNEYPYRTPWEMFKTDVENTLVSNGLASYNDIVKSIAKLEEKLNINKDFRLFNGNQFVGWKSYYDLPKVEKALSDMEAAMKTTNSFDLSIADRLCDSYPEEAVCSMLTDRQKEILILGVEFERDFGNDVSENLYRIYKAITDENTMLNDTQPEMTM